MKLTKRLSMEFVPRYPSEYVGFFITINSSVANPSYRLRINGGHGSFVTHLGCGTDDTAMAMVAAISLVAPFAAQGDFYLRAERERTRRRERAAACAQPDKLAFQRRLENERRLARFAELICRHHFSGEPNFKGAGRLQVPGRKKQLRDRFGRLGRSETGWHGDDREASESKQT